MKAIMGLSATFALLSFGFALGVYAESKNTRVAQAGWIESNKLGIDSLAAARQFQDVAEGCLAQLRRR